MRSSHDSFIVDYRLSQTTWLLMRLAADRVLRGNHLLVDRSLPGLDNVEREAGIQTTFDHARFCQSPRSPGYLRRMAAHEAEYGPLPPYSMLNPIQIARRTKAMAS